MEIKIYFTDFWDNFNINDNIITRILEKYYKVVITKKPKYLFCSVFGEKYLDFPNVIRICINGENAVPDFTVYDYIISMQKIIYRDRYLCADLFFLNPDNKVFINKVLNKQYYVSEVSGKSKFCAFVYSNSGADSRREKIFDMLSEYKQVDSGGEFRNNIGYLVDDKIKFLEDYKFSIAFENSQTIGYTTEKIFDAMAGDTIPIYWGDIDIGKRINVKSIINCNDFMNFHDVIEYVKKIDNNDELYYSIKNEPWVTQEQYSEYVDIEKRFISFLNNIFRQNCENAYRRPKGQWKESFERKRQKQNEMYKAYIIAAKYKTVLVRLLVKCRISIINLVHFIVKRDKF